MKRKLNKVYNFQVWLTTTFAFPSLFILYRLLGWQKEEFSVLGILYLLLLAVAIGGVVSMPSFLVSRAIRRFFTQKHFSIRRIRLATAAVSTITLFSHLALINLFVYTLHKNLQLLGLFYAVCVTLASFIFEPVEKGKEEMRQSPKLQRTPRWFLYS